MTDATMRVFVGAFPPPEVQAAAERAIERLRRAGDGVSWVKRDNLHVTLRFLGELGEDGTRRVGEAATEAGRAIAPFDAGLGRAGAFPNARRARVLWLGLEPGASEMEQLAAVLDRSLALRGFEPEGRRFRAHLTIGRVRVGDADWSEALASASAVEAPFRVEELRVIQSRLSPKGSIYTPIGRAPLVGSAAGV
jgi:2'-5' RNA ligase